MKAQISPQDWERISAYLDGQLDASAAEKVKRDMETHPELHQAFAELRKYKAILKQVPMRRVRRNFTLKPAMVGVKPQPRLVPVFRLVSAVMAAVAVVLFAIDLLPSLTGFFAAAPQAVSQSALAAGQATAGPEIIYWNGQQNYISNLPAPTLAIGGGAAQGVGGGYGGGGGGGGASPSTENVAPTSQLPTEPTLTPETPPTIAEVAPAVKQGLTPEPTQQAFLPPSPTDIAADQAIQSGAESPILGIPPADQQGKIIPAPGETLREANTVPQPSRVLTYLAIGLFLFSAGGLTLSVALSRKS